MCSPNVKLSTFKKQKLNDHLLNQVNHYQVDQSSKYLSEYQKINDLCQRNLNFNRGQVYHNFNQCKTKYILAYIGTKLLRAKTSSGSREISNAKTHGRAGTGPGWVNRRDFRQMGKEIVTKGIETRINLTGFQD